MFLFSFCVLATVTRAQTTPSREYIHEGTRVIAIEVPTPAVAAPTFSPAGENYNARQTVTISTSTAGATIRYTLDGTTPPETNGIVGTSVGIGGLKDAQGCSSPGLVRRDATGRTMAVVVQPRMPATILISNAAFALADDKGNALGLGVKQFPVPSATAVSTASASATAQPVVTVQVTGRK